MAAPTFLDYRDLSDRRFGGGGRRLPRDRPRVTVITVALNACGSLARTIESVQAQTFDDLEHIVVDGGSSDGTCALLQAALRKRDTWISEPDAGISDAFNKGIALAAGDYLQFVNADDWMEPGQIAIAVRGLESSGAEFVFGDLIFYQSDRADFRYRGDPDYTKLIRRRMPALNHPTALIRREAFERVGLFDPSYRCAMDYDWFLRLHLAGGRGMYLADLVGHMNHDGISNTQFHRTMREVREIAVKHGRASLPARTEELYQHTKIAVGRLAKARARPFYDFVRRWLNASFRPLE